jgi:hypothetical protein
MEHIHCTNMAESAALNSIYMNKHKDYIMMLLLPEYRQSLFDLIAFCRLFRTHTDGI